MCLGSNKRMLPIRLIRCIRQSLLFVYVQSLWLYPVSQFHICFLADLTIMTEHITLYTLLVSVALIGYNQVGCSPPNILFLASDDMRPEIGAYLASDFPSPVHPDIHTPNLDKLAKQSLLLKRAYVQQAVCSPSRTSLLTGRRPDTTHVHDLIRYFRQVAGNFTTIPQYFKEHGYSTAGSGKIFHPGQASGGDDPPSWTEPYFHGNRAGWDESYSVTWYAAEEEKLKKYPLEDQQNTNHTKNMLRKLAANSLQNGKPFFMAHGFMRPHLHFVAPARFFDFYPTESIRLPPNMYAPVNMPPIAWARYEEMWNYKDIGLKYGYAEINSTYPDQIVKNLRRAYYASITYADSLLGDILDVLDEVGVADNTIISFWGDHGWQLGEHAEWCKHTNFEIATHATMMVRVPGLTDGGVVTERLTGFVDLFPTLVEAAGLPKISICSEDSLNITTCTEGISLVPLMKDPSRPWKSAAFSQYPRMDEAGDPIMGYTMKTDRYHYTEWVDYNDFTYKPIWSMIYKNSVELYDHQIDPEENHNRAHKSSYSEVVKQLSKQLHAGWRDAPPLKR